MLSIDSPQALLVGMVIVTHASMKCRVTVSIPNPSVPTERLSSTNPTKNHMNQFLRVRISKSLMLALPVCIPADTLQLDREIGDTLLLFSLWRPRLHTSCNLTSNVRSDSLETLNNPFPITFFQFLTHLSLPTHTLNLDLNPDNALLHDL